MASHRAARVSWSERRAASLPRSCHLELEERPDSDDFIAHVKAHGMRAVIPSRRHRWVQRRLNPVIYALRNVVERWFGRPKVFRRVATRYEKTAPSYLGFVAMAAALLVLTGWPE